jgi:hypothetical protein
MTRRERSDHSLSKHRHACCEACVRDHARCRGTAKQTRGWRVTGEDSWNDAMVDAERHASQVIPSWERAGLVLDDAILAREPLRMTDALSADCRLRPHKRSLRRAGVRRNNLRIFCVHHPRATSRNNEALCRVNCRAMEQRPRNRGLSRRGRIRRPRAGVAADRALDLRPPPGRARSAADAADPGWGASEIGGGVNLLIRIHRRNRVKARMLLRVVEPGLNVTRSQSRCRNQGARVNPRHCLHLGTARAADRTAARAKFLSNACSHPGRRMRP